MSWKRLAALAPNGTVPVVGRAGIVAGVFSSNLFLFIDGSIAGPEGVMAVRKMESDRPAIGPGRHREAHQVLAAQGVPPI
jgi:hypothetical protein